MKIHALTRTGNISRYPALAIRQLLAGDLIQHDPSEQSWAKKDVVAQGHSSEMGRTWSKVRHHTHQAWASQPEAVTEKWTHACHVTHCDCPLRQEKLQGRTWANTSTAAPTSMTRLRPGGLLREPPAFIGSLLASWAILALSLSASPTTHGNAAVRRCM